MLGKPVILEDLKKT